MKSKIISIFSIFFILLMVGCTNKNPVTDKDPNSNENPITDNEDKDSETSTPKEDEISNPVDEDKEELIIEPVIKNRNARIYTFNKDELALYYYDTSLEVTDNALVNALTKELQSNLPNESFLSLTDKVGVTSAKLDQDKNLLTIVFSDSFVDNMLLGNSTESGLLSSLICTYGYNYDVDKVAIYFKDKLYTSLKGDLEAGYFEVNYSEAKEYKN